jgi:transcriptional antiterminator
MNIENEEVYINNILYTKIGYLKNLKFENADNVLSSLEHWGYDEKIFIMQQILENKEWYVLETTLSSSMKERIAICQIDNICYFVTLRLNESNENSKIYRIDTLTIK